MQVTGEVYVDPLETVFADLAQHGSVATSRWPPEVALTPAAVGLAESDGLLRWIEAPDALDPARVSQALPQLTLEYFRSIDSTNTHLLNRVASAAGRLCVAELQHGGRGRRGRRWLSPYGRNLAMSLGVATGRELSELGGLSCAVGVGVAAALQHLGVKDVQLKWPNDVLWRDRKLCGILVELVRRPQGTGPPVNEVIVGVGINVALAAADRAAIDQPVADLQEAGVDMGRTGLLIELAGRLRTTLDEFDAEGFAPLAPRFDALHRFHEERCVLLQGDAVTTGTVVGVNSNGELLLDTPEGVAAFHGGEVSLRPS